MPIRNKNFASDIFDLLIEITAKQGLEFRDKIQRFRSYLEMIFKELTKSETRLFSNLSSRCEFVFETENTPLELRIEISGLRKFANRIVHNEITEVKDIPIEEKKAIKVLCFTLEHFFNVQTPEVLKKLFDGEKNLTYRTHRKSVKDKIPFISASVLKIIHPKDNKKFCILKCIDEEGDRGELSIALWDDLQYIGKNAWEYCKINFFNLIYDAEKNIPGYYSSTHDTLVVIEPDYLYDASALAECFSTNEGVPIIYFLKRFMYSEKTQEILKGLAVNYMLDELLINPSADSNELLEDFFKDNLLSLVLLDNNSNSNIINDINNKHIKNIREITEQYKNYNILIEPAFYSAKYGISGRLDCLIDYGDGRKDIFELKSGNEPRINDVYLSNKYQITAYNLLLKSAFEGKSHGSSMIFYSAAESNPLRNVSNSIFEEKALLKIRNRIINGEYMLSTGDVNFFKIFLPDNFGSIPDYMKTEAYILSEKYSKAGELLKKYFRHFSSFMARELWISKIGSNKPGENSDYGFSSIWRESLSEKIDNSSVLHSLLFDKYDKEKNSYKFRFEKTDMISNFRENDTAIIYPQNGNESNPLLNQILKCTISSISNDSVIINLRNKQISADHFLSNGKWVIEHDLQETGFNSFTQSLTDLLHSQKSELLLGIKKPEFAEYDYNNPDLKKSQNEIIKKALSAKDYYLIQGPPGTGKTSFALIAILKEILKNSQSKTAILTFTNRAANQICENLLKNSIEFLRLGDDGSENDYLLKNKIKSLNVNEIRELIKNTRIIVSTVHSFIGKYKDLEPIIKFDTVIVDEASQLLEPHIIGILSRCTKFILIGDQFQLPAISLQNESETVIEDEKLKKIGFYDLKVSLFERLFNQCLKNRWVDAVGILEFHYRMHDDIAQLINPYYKNKLISATDKQKSPEIKIKNDLSPIEKSIMKSRLIYIPSKKLIQNQYNTNEAEIVKDILNIIKKFYGDKFDENTAGVITPWRKQIRCIKDLITDEEIKSKVVIDTVERYQGSERENIIISTALFSINQLHNIQSLTYDRDVDRKLNVALSRAISRLIITGCEEILMQDVHYKRVLNIIKTKGKILKI